MIYNLEGPIEKKKNIMEIETKKHQRIIKRRERAQQIYQEKRNEPDGSADEMDESPPRSSKDKGRSKPRRRRNSSNSIEEDIIDGFAVISFKNFEDLEVCSDDRHLIFLAWPNFISGVK